MNGSSIYVIIAAIAALVLWRRMRSMYRPIRGIGIVFPIPLIWTTNYEVREDNLIYAQKNWGFIAAFIGILIIRFALRQELSDMDPQALMTLFMMVPLDTSFHGGSYRLSNFVG